MQPAACGPQITPTAGATDVKVLRRRSTRATLNQDKKARPPISIKVRPMVWLIAAIDLAGLLVATLTSDALSIDATINDLAMVIFVSTGIRPALDGWRTGGIAS